MTMATVFKRNGFAIEKMIAETEVTSGNARKTNATGRMISPAETVTASAKGGGVTETPIVLTPPMKW